jgi:S-(hydroxymethyl)glutathione dehydrogenase/alcohol dehydrogenase
VRRFRLSYLRIRARAFNVAEGSTVAVFGCGCVGLSCINAANLVEASRVIAIDVNPAKEKWARKFGATDYINPRQLPEGKRIQDHLIELTDGGLDFTFDATGNVSCAHHKPCMMPQRFFV